MSVLKAGTVLQGRYRVDRKLGQGGMGSVYEGEHLLIKRRVAIKVLHAQFAEKPEIVARFHREAHTATAIGHPHIIEVTDLGQLPDGSPYMVLEFLKGRDYAADLEEQGPQPLGKTARILTQVCQALGAAHTKQIVHRDLKPENIFLLERHGTPDYVKVLDFGISKFLGEMSEELSLTQSGTALGTPYYMSPEHCQGRKDLDGRADIYSLGVILFYALAGQFPFDSDTYPMLVLKICAEPPPDLSRWRPDLPPQIVNLVNAMLAKHAQLRPETCALVEAALQPFLHDNSPAPKVDYHLPADAPSESGLSLTGPLTGSPATTPATGQAKTTPLGSAAVSSAGVSSAGVSSAGVSSAGVSSATPGSITGPLRGPLDSAPGISSASAPALTSPERANSGGKWGLLLLLFALIFMGALGGGAFALYDGAADDDAPSADTGVGPAAQDAGIAVQDAGPVEEQSADAGETPRDSGEGQNNDAGTQPPVRTTDGSSGTTGGSAQAANRPRRRARLHVVLVPFGSARLDGENIQLARTIPIAPGPHRLTATSAGRRQVRNFTVRPGATQRIVIRF